MIKGVNRRIVEITGMENDYFEKAILYVRPDKSAVSQTRIDLEARSAVGRFVPKENAALMSPKKKLSITLKLAAISAVLIVLSLLMYILIVSAVI